LGFKNEYNIPNFAIFDTKIDDFSKVSISQILDDFFYLSGLSIGRCLIKYKLLGTTYLAMPFLA
jgi:hypothetical protein